MAAVAHRLQNAHACVIQDGGQASQEVQPEIQNGGVQHVRRCAHPGEDGGGEEYAQKRQQYAAAQGEGKVGMDGGADLFIVLGPEILGNDDARADEQTHKKACHHKNEVAAAGHSGQSLLAHKFAHDDTVHRVVQLLAEIAQKDRHCKADHALPDGAGGHIGAAVDGGHAASPPYVKKSSVPSL